MPIFSQVTVTAAGTAATTASPWIPLNQYAQPFNVGFGVITNPGTGHLTYTVQHTFDNVFDPSVSARAFDHSVVSGKSATAASTQIDGNYAFPVAAIRLQIVSGSGTSPSATLLVRQAGL